MRWAMALISTVIILSLGAYLASSSPLTQKRIHRAFETALIWLGLDLSESSQRKTLMQPSATLKEVNSYFFSFFSNPDDLPQAVIQRYFENLRKGDTKAIEALFRLETHNGARKLPQQARQILKRFGGLVDYRLLTQSEEASLGDQPGTHFSLLYETWYRQQKAPLKEAFTLFEPSGQGTILIVTHSIMAPPDP
jgi:hypothetical protein